MDIKRTILWVIFSMSLVLLYDNWQRANGHASMFFPSTTQRQAASAPAASGAAAQGDVPKANVQPGAAAPAGAPGAAPQAAAQPTGEKIVVTTDTVRAEIDTAGGIVSRLELLKEHEKDGKPVVLFERDNVRTYMARSGLIGGDLPNHTTLFTAAPGPRALDGAEQLQVVLSAEKNGVKLVKTYTFRKGSYVVDSKFDVTNAGTAPVSPTLYLELARDGSKVEQSQFYSTFTGPAVYTDADKYHKIDFEDIAKGKATVPAAANNGWVAMVQHYFASAWIPQTGKERSFYVQQIDPHLYRVGIQQPLGEVAPGATVSTDARLFAGPQEEHMLEKIAPGLELVKDYGWLTILAKPLFWLLEKLHGFLGNWGWSIIALTVLIKLVFFPLSAASYKSMGKMKDLQPRMTSIRERYKNDPQKMNQEMMALYRTEKVNPLGGCLPIVIQIPVFIALYWVLLSSVEMRGAPWLGWIKDLSVPDPFYILPIVMAVSMFVQTKLNPTPPDPVQAKVMTIMPLVFSVMFFFFPAGLVLYWVVNNILSIAQQWQINRMLGKGKAAVVAKS
ncbi:preprotein translocase, cooperates with SecYEG and SecDFyajC translocon, membrane component [Cupriavidus taiwanensis]|uniref:Membrane protein insertase YidC n=1 Tax=Cupriavidus taiwanensis TaxID=164546 RepID=A0A976AT07_9BURK|nr:membrane protein insertase YidC [Cupriavidus taiwanensis]SOZ47872.1 preprotein translocase, cooperates with SecYEG and SecDFyajC translocon, membrane component [Cupriavidus taiwanensis]SOZ48772.1 preprotein translocase, cooperates with SecYEG and SecDFyajC translocon, membrane component [Cupriavidus taiwanensis]SOZ51588.1 preprotein translocase, cooperates with SecYEG and SecDFyajC translocon, membrane component [Cupriavidus taiwanensis]SPA03976.1 preprotein translocase, cooperates with SecY